MRIEAKDVGVRIGGTVLLDGIDLSLRAGEMVGLIGPNGAGKTTLLRILAGLRAPDGGTVRYDGMALRQIGRRALSRRVAFLAQGGPVHWPMRAADLVALGRLPHRRPFGGLAASDMAAVERAVVRAGIEPLRYRVMGTLSGGERMRMLLARALAVEAEILLADEPVTALDPLHQLQAMDLLREVARAGAGVVVVLHDLNLAARFCDRLVLLANGGILADDAPRDVLTRAYVAEAYGVELLRGEHDGSIYVVPWLAKEGPRTGPSRNRH